MKVLVRVMIENRQEVLLSECAEWFDHDMVRPPPLSRPGPLGMADSRMCVRFGVGI